MTIRATTTPGVEDVALAEGNELLTAHGFNVVASTAQVFGLPGVVSWGLGERSSYAVVAREAPFARARALYHIAVHIAEVAWDGESLDSLVAGVGAVDLDELDRASSFRVSCSRSGEHAFQSPDVERRVGAVLQERYGTRVDLEHYGLHVKVDVTGSRAFCGYQLTGRKGLDRRYQWVYHPRVTLRTPIAYAMLRLAGYVGRPGALYDPFCGSGTILLEAAGVADDTGLPPPPIAGSDRDPAAVEGARANLAADGRADTVAVGELDARELASHLEPASADYIVTNPPFGVRLGKGVEYHGFYRDVLEAVARVLRRDGVLVMLVGKRRGVFNRVLQGFPEFRLRHVRMIEMGGLYAAMFILGRTAAEASSFDESRNQD